MTPSDSTAPKKPGLSARRIALLATTIAGVGAAAFVGAPNLDLHATYPMAHAQNLSEQAQRLPAPQGFADIVAKVKPAVISVRVKIEGNKTAGLSGNDQIPPDLRDFFRRFGMPGTPGCRAMKAGRAVAVAGAAAVSCSAKVRDFSFRPTVMR